MRTVDLPTPLPLIPFERIMEEPLPPIDWLVEGLIAQGDRVVIYGEFGSLKSWLLLDLAVHLAAGHPWLGQFSIPKVKQVLYIDEEMNERTLRRRIKRLGLGAGLESPALPFQAMSRVGVRFDPDGAERLLRALAASEFDPDVVIVEAFRRVLVGSENEAEDVSAFWRHVQPLLRAGKTLILSHHMRKPHFQGTDANRDRASGSTDILAGADTAFAIQRLSKGSVILDCIKVRESEEPSPFAVSLYEEPDGQDGDGPISMRYEGSPAEFQAQSSKLERAMVLVEAFLTTQPQHAAETRTILAHLDTHDIRTRTGERALKGLEGCGRLCQPERGRWQLLQRPQAA